MTRKLPLKNSLLSALNAGAIMISVACIVWSYNDGQFGVAHWVAFFLTWLSVILMAWKASPDPFSPVWLLIGYLFTCFFIRPLYILFMNEQAHLFVLSRLAVQPNFLLLNDILLFATTASFLVGYNSSRGVMKKMAYYSPYFVDSINRKLFKILASLIFVSAIIAYVYVVQKVGGIAYVLNSQAALVKAIPELGFDVKLAWVILNMYFLGTILYLIVNGASKGWYFLFLLGLILMISIGRRSSILAMIIPLLIYRHYFVARLSLKKAAIWGGLVFALLVGIAIFRILTAASRTELEATAIFASAEYFTWDMNMAVLDQTGGFVKFRDGLDFLPYWFRGLFDLDQYGVSFVSIGEMTVARYFPSFPAGIPAGIQGTLYMDWGWSGVVVGMWMMGVAARYWYEYLLCNLKSRLVVLLIYPVGLMAFFYLLRLGDFWLGFSAQIRFIVASIGLAFVLNRFRIVTRGIKKQNKMGNIKNHDLLPQRDLSQAC